MAAMGTLAVEPLSASALDGCALALGLAADEQQANPAFHSPLSDFWHVHDFDPGDDGAPEILWVRYRNATMIVTALEAHLGTEQAVVPLDGAIVQVVCRTGSDGTPDLKRLRAVHVPAGTGVLMLPGCWHATLVSNAAETTCLMLTRASTTRDLVGHLVGGAPLVETRIVALAEHGGPVRVTGAAAP